MPIASSKRRTLRSRCATPRRRWRRRKADLANILYGRRPEEIAALDANFKAAQVTADDAGRTFQRRQNLLERGYACQADYDAAKTASTSPPRACANSRPIWRWRNCPPATTRSPPPKPKWRRRRRCATTPMAARPARARRAERGFRLRHRAPRRRRRRPAGAGRLVPARRRDQAEGLRAGGARSPASRSGRRWTCAATAARRGSPPTSPISRASPNSRRRSSIRWRAGRRWSI